MIRRQLWAPLVALAISCHSPNGAQKRATDGPTASAQATAQRFAEIEPILASSFTPALMPQEAPKREKPASMPPAEPPPETIDLCCDMPSGLCYRDDGARCLTETSRMIECPAIAVREITGDFVVCAD